MRSEDLAQHSLIARDLFTPLENGINCAKAILRGRQPI